MTSDKRNYLIERLNTIEEKLRSSTVLKEGGLRNEIRLFTFDVAGSKASHGRG